MLETVDTEYVHHCSDKSLAKICVSCEIKYKDIFLVLKKCKSLNTFGDRTRQKRPTSLVYIIIL